MLNCDEVSTISLKHMSFFTNRKLVSCSHLFFSCCLPFICYPLHIRFFLHSFWTRFEGETNSNLRNVFARIRISIQCQKQFSQKVANTTDEHTFIYYWPLLNSESFEFVEFVVGFFLFFATFLLERRFFSLNLSELEYVNPFPAIDTLNKSNFFQNDNAILSLLLLFRIKWVRCANEARLSSIHARFWRKIFGWEPNNRIFGFIYAFGLNLIFIWSYLSPYKVFRQTKPYAKILTCEVCNRYS